MNKKQNNYSWGFIPKFWHACLWKCLHGRQITQQVSADAVVNRRVQNQVKIISVCWNCCEQYGRVGYFQSERSEDQCWWGVYLAPWRCSCLEELPCFQLCVSTQHVVLIWLSPTPFSGGRLRPHWCGLLIQILQQCLVCCTASGTDQ